LEKTNKNWSLGFYLNYFRAVGINEKSQKKVKFVSRAHAFCLDFHAYQTISAVTTTHAISISIE